MFGFRMPTRVHILPGCLDRLPEALRSVGVTRALLVVDPGLAATPWPEEARRMLTQTTITVEIFDDVAPNPRTTTALAAAEKIREHELDGVVGLGGGSALDVAKAAAMLATNDGQPEHFEGKGRYSNAPLPFVAVPTTCGTGSEVTWVSVLTHAATSTKISLKGESMFPRFALVDAELIRTLPSSLIAWTGLDAMTHAVEATTCRVANPVSDALAEKAIALLLRYLPRAVADIEGDDDARISVMRASTLAGLAFGNADVAGVHCLSEAAGGLNDVPHGLANAILLAPTMRYHQEHIAERLARIERLLDPPNAEAPIAERAESFLSRLEGLTKTLEIPAWSSFGIPPEKHERLAELAAKNGSNRSNPQPMAKQDYLAVLEGLD